MCTTRVSLDICNIYTVSTQYLHSICTISTQYLHISTYLQVRHDPGVCVHGAGAADPARDAQHGGGHGRRQEGARHGRLLSLRPGEPGLNKVIIMY